MFSKTRYFDPCFINTIERDETYHGQWWLPQNPSNKVSGVLRLYKVGGIRLHLIGMFSADAGEIFGLQFVDHEIILGELVPGNRSITLIDCKERMRESPTLTNTIDGAVQRFKIEKVLFFKHVYSLQELKFKSFEFSTTYLSEWVNSKRVKVELKNKESTIHLLPQSELVANAKDYQITFASKASTNLEGLIDQNTSVILKFKTGISFEEFEWKYLNPLLDLIQFSTSFLNSMKYLHASVEESDFRQIVSTSEFDCVTKEKESIHPYILFHLSDVENHWEDFVLNWIEFHNKSKHIFKLYFDSILLGFQFRVSKFLNIIQAVESYHREASKRDVSLKNRLTDLLAEANGIFARIVIDQEAFLSKIVSTRNFYTHYSSDKKIKAATDLELLAITEALRILLNFHICLACGMEKAKIEQLIINNHIFINVEQLVNENVLWKVHESNKN